MYSDFDPEHFPHADRDSSFTVRTESSVSNRSLLSGKIAAMPSYPAQTSKYDKLARVSAMDHSVRMRDPSRFVTSYQEASMCGQEAKVPWNHRGHTVWRFAKSGNTQVPSCENSMLR